MRLESVSIEGFRCYQAETTVQFEDLTMVVGRNDAGKSAILDALAVFFEEAKLETDDRCVAASGREVSITCAFTDLPAEVVLDAAAPTTLGGEHLLDAAGRLVVKKTFDGSLATPKLTGVYAHALHPTAEGLKDLHTKKNPDLKRFAQQLGVELDGVNQSYNTELRAAIWASCSDLQIEPVDVVLEQPKVNSIWKSLSAYLPQYALFKSDRASTDQDAEAQDPLKSAIKAALEDKTDELDALAAHVETEVRKVAEATLAKLQDMDASLASELSPTFNKPSWHGAFKVSLTDDTQVPINKRGSGVRRLILLNFFRAKAEEDSGRANRPGTIYAVEEPETSQHPSNQLLLLSAFRDIASQEGNQVILTSHTPVLARRLDVQALRYVEVLGPCSREVHGPGEDTNGLIAKDLGVLADHDVRVFVGVEGKHDIEYLCRIAQVLRDHGESVPDLRLEEARGRLVFVPLGGSNLSLWVSRLAPLARPEVHIFDRDTVPPEPPAHQTEATAINARADAEAVITGLLEMENYIAPAAIAAARPDLGTIPPLGPFVDVPVEIAKLVHASGGSPTAWEDLDDERRKKKESKAKFWLNRNAVDMMTPAHLSSVDPGNDVRGWLGKIGQHL